MAELDHLVEYRYRSTRLSIYTNVDILVPEISDTVLVYIAERQMHRSHHQGVE